MNNKLFLPGLNGLRAMAAMSVVFSHIGHNLHRFGLPKFTWDLAGFGVTIFFSLSGFLITYLLLLEKQKDNIIHIKNFYIRRVLRIWPLYFLYLSLALLVIYIENRNVVPGILACYIFLAANIPFILGHPLPYVAHYWSLAVEEQFYLFWPWLVKKSNSLFQVLVGFIGCMLLLKFLFRYVEIRTGNDILYTIISVTRFHCMAIGALGAYLYYYNNKIFLSITQNMLIQLLAWLNIAIIAINKFHIASIIDNEIVAITTVILIINQIANPKTVISLEKPLLDFLGKISFGMYVYHPLIIVLVAIAFRPQLSLLSEWIQYSVIYLVIPSLTIFTAWLSYNFYEKRFLKMKTQFSTIQSAGSKVEG